MFTLHAVCAARNTLAVVPEVEITTGYATVYLEVYVWLSKIVANRYLLDLSVSTKVILFHAIAALESDHR